MTHTDILTKPSQNTKPAALGFGFMRLPSDINEVIEMTDVYLETGSNYFDTAYVYGGSEEALKKALTTRHPRDSYLLADKIPPWKIKKPADCDRIFNESLSRLGVDYVDFLLIHALDDFCESKAVKNNLYDWVSGQKAKGTAKHIGFSFHGSDKLLEQILNTHPEMEFVQLQFNYLDDMRGQAGKWVETARRFDKPIILMEPVKGGTLANLPPAAKVLMQAHAWSATPASWAMRYAAMTQGATCVLSGMSNMAQMRDNINSFNPFVALSEKEISILKAVLNELSKTAAIPCTACKYCLADCPRQIDIPTCLNLYNEIKRGGAEFWNLKILYDAIPKENRAETCTECGVCIVRCPQKIDVPKVFKDLAVAFK